MSYCNSSDPKFSSPFQVLVGNTGFWSAFLGVLELEVDQFGNVISWGGDTVPSDTLDVALTGASQSVLDLFSEVRILPLSSLPGLDPTPLRVISHLI